MLNIKASLFTNYSIRNTEQTESNGSSKNGAQGPPGGLDSVWTKAGHEETRDRAGCTDQREDAEPEGSRGWPRHAHATGGFDRRNVKWARPRCRGERVSHE